MGGGSLGAVTRYLAGLFPSVRHLALLGFCLPQIWMYVIVQAVNGEGIAPMVGFHCASGIVLLACAALYRTRPSLPQPRWASTASAVAMGCLPLYLALPVAGMPAPMDTALSIVAGAGCAWCFMEWFGVCCATGARNAVSYLLLSFALAAAIRIVLALLPFKAAFWVLVLLCTLSIPLLPVALQLKGASGGMGPSPTAPAGHHTLFILMELALYSFVLGSVNDASSESQALTFAMVLNYALRIVLMLMLFAWFAAAEQRSSVARVAQVALCAIVIGVLAIALLGDAASVVAASLISFARGIVLMLLALVSVETTFSLRLHPFVAFGVGRGVYEFSVMGGRLFSHYVLGEAFSITLTLNIVFFMVGCIFLFITGRTAKTVLSLEGGVTPSAPAHAVAERCRAVASRYNLTERETEVLELLCRGRGKAYIAEALCVSENTVRHHCKNIYSKLQVHSREELMDLIGVM